jgi:hypothetical protein
MPNSIKFNESAETLALKRGNFYIGTGDVGKGPTSTTGYYNGITPPSGGYTIYLNKASQGPSIYTVGSDAGLISLTNRIAGANYTTATQCFEYFLSQSDKMCFNMDYEGIVTNGLILDLDLGFVPSYPKTGSTISDVSPSANNGTIFSNPTYSSNDGGILTFNGTSQGGYTSNINWAGSFSVGMWVNLQSWRFIDCPCSGVGNGVMSSLLQGPDGYWNMWGLETTSYNNNVTGQAIFFTYYNTSYNGVSIGLGGSLNVWQYYFVSYNSTGNAVGYRNGSQVASQAITGQITPNVPLYINYLSQHCGYCWSQNKTAIVQVYNRALTSNEVLQNYNAQKSRFGL